MQVDIKINPDFSIAFSESIWLYHDLSGFFSVNQAPGDTDLWARLRSLCKANGWNFKAKASNHLILTGQAPATASAALFAHLADQIPAMGAAAGVKAKDVNAASKVLKYKLDRNDGFFAVRHQLVGDIDLTAKTLAELMLMPKQLEFMINHHAQLKDGAKVAIRAEFPFRVVRTNGTLDKQLNSVSWNLKIGKVNHIEFVLEQYNWHVIFVVAGLGILIVALLVWLFLRHQSSQSKTRSDQI